MVPLVDDSIAGCAGSRLLVLEGVEVRRARPSANGRRRTASDAEGRAGEHTAWVRTPGVSFLGVAPRAPKMGKALQIDDLQGFSRLGGESGIRTPDLRIMIPSL